MIVIELLRVIIKGTKETNDKLEIFVELEKKEHICPNCKSRVTRIQDYRYQKVRDLDILGKKTFIILKKKRYECSCGKVFLEDNNFLNKRQRMTKRFEDFILHRLERQSANSLSKEIGISVNRICLLKRKSIKEKSRGG